VEYGEVRRIAVGGTVPLDFEPSVEEVAAADAVAESAVAAAPDASGLNEAGAPGKTDHFEPALEADSDKASALPVGAIVAVIVATGALLAFVVLR